jgi:predicted peroxiredoxin
MGKAAISLTTGLEDAERVTVAFLQAVGAAEGGREVWMFLTQEAVHLATAGTAKGSHCDGCPALEDLMARFAAAGGKLLVCSVCFNSRKMDAATLVENASVGGTIALWEWIGDGPCTTFSY